MLRAGLAIIRARLAGSALAGKRLAGFLAPLRCLNKAASIKRAALLASNAFRRDAGIAVYNDGGCHAYCRPVIASQA